MLRKLKGGHAERGGCAPPTAPPPPLNPALGGRGKRGARGKERSWGEGARGAIRESGRRDREGDERSLGEWRTWGDGRGGGGSNCMQHTSYICICSPPQYTPALVNQLTYLLRHKDQKHLEQHALC